MSEPIDQFKFVMDQRRKFMKEMAALTGLAMISSAEARSWRPHFHHW